MRIGGVLLARPSAVMTRFSLGSLLLFVLFVDARPGGRGRTRHGRLDSEHHRQHPHLRARQDSVRLYVAAHVLLRFCADFIEKNIGLSPVGILLVCAMLACIGLNLVSGIANFGFALVALAVYARRQDVFLADDAGRGLATAFRAPAPSPSPSWAASA